VQAEEPIECRLVDTIESSGRHFGEGRSAGTRNLRTNHPYSASKPSFEARSLPVKRSARSLQCPEQRKACQRTGEFKNWARLPITSLNAAGETPPAVGKDADRSFKEECVYGFFFDREQHLVSERRS
jgi:hypothetical protein